MRKGFTLVELSIVLVIIGLLISGILVGQSMTRSAEIMQIQKNVFYYEVNAKKFMEATKYLPGDIPNTVSTPMGIGGSWGNGTGLVGYTADGTGGSGLEYWTFFYHMERLNLIKRPKEYATRPVSAALYPLKGTSGLKENGIRVMNSEYATQCGNKTTNTANLVSLDLDKPDADFFITNKPVNFNAADAAALDQKFDDGLPESGDIWTYGSAAISGTARGDCKTVDNSKYNLNSTNTGCPILFCLRSLRK